MARHISFEIPLDTAMCSPQQVHPWAMMATAMSGWARWLRAYLVPFRSLIKEHGTGVVILGYDLEYLERFSFFDDDAFDLTVTTRIRDDGTLFWFDLKYASSQSVFAEANVVGKVVRLGREDSLAARPGALPRTLMKQFGSDDRFEGSVPRTLAAAAEQVKWQAQTDAPLRMHRGLCEAADQWCFTELPRIVADRREAWALDADDPHANLGLAKPVRRFIAELTRPMFIFDSATVTTAIDDSRLRYLHRIHGDEHQHATVFEELGEPTGDG